MTSQLNEELAQRGFLMALEVSRKYKFSIDFVRQVKDITRLQIIFRHYECRYSECARGQIIDNYFFYL